MDNKNRRIKIRVVRCDEQMTSINWTRAQAIIAELIVNKYRALQLQHDESKKQAH